MRKKLAQALLVNLSPVKKYIKKDSALPKEDIIRRCAGEVPYTVLQTLKQLIFDMIGKDSNDELYLV